MHFVLAPASLVCGVFQRSCSRRVPIRSASKPSAKLLELTHGAYCPFAPGAASELGELLRAAAAYAAGGMKALAALRASSTSASKLIEQMR